MATPKEQHDARSNARNIGSLTRHPADATPAGGVPAVVLPRGDAPRGDAPPAPEDDVLRIREPRPAEVRIGDPPR